MNEIPEWLNDFVLKSFAGYEVMNQQDFVQKQKDEQSLNQQNSINDTYRDESEKSNAIGINDQTGDKFEVVVNKMNKDKKDKGLQVEFASGAKKDKYICSSLAEFCGGRYANLEGFPLDMVANTIAKDHSYIIKTRSVYEHGGLKWEVDEYHDMKLVTLEVELDDINQEITIPEIIEDMMIVEITGQKVFSNENLSIGVV